MAALCVSPERQRYIDEVKRMDLFGELTGSKIEKTRELSGRKCARVYLDFKSEKGRDAFIFQTIDSKRDEMVAYRKLAMTFREVGYATKVMVHITVHGHFAYQDPQIPDRDVDKSEDSEKENIDELGQTTALERVCILLNGMFKTDQFKA